MNLQSLKSIIRHRLRVLSDAFSGHDFCRRDSAPKASAAIGCHCLRLSHPFMPAQTLENKKHNLRQAAVRINGAAVRPGQVFSFWRMVGNPNDATRFREGRSIHAGKAVIDRGGGLCQASGIIHHASLLMQLDVVERHNHSVDLYTEKTRFAPLGTDATVFFGYKDLRVRNNTDAMLRFVLTVTDAALRLDVYSDKELRPCRLVTEVNVNDSGVKDVAIYSPDGRCLCRSSYLPHKD